VTAVRPGFLVKSQRNSREPHLSELQVLYTINCKIERRIDSDEKVGEGDKENLQLAQSAVAPAFQCCNKFIKIKKTSKMYSSKF